MSQVSCRGRTLGLDEVQFCAYSSLMNKTLTNQEAELLAAIEASNLGNTARTRATWSSRFGAETSAMVDALIAAGLIEERIGSFSPSKALYATAEISVGTDPVAR